MPIFVTNIYSIGYCIQKVIFVVLLPKFVLIPLPYELLPHDCVVQEISGLVEFGDKETDTGLF